MMSTDEQQNCRDTELCKKINNNIINAHLHTFLVVSKHQPHFYHNIYPWNLILELNSKINKEHFPCVYLCVCVRVKKKTFISL